MQLVITLKGAMFAIASHHTSMLTTQMIACVSTINYYVECILHHSSVVLIIIVGEQPKINRIITEGIYPMYVYHKKLT